MNSEFDPTFMDLVHFADSRNKYFIWVTDIKNVRNLIKHFDFYNYPYRSEDGVHCLKKSLFSFVKNASIVSCRLGVPLAQFPANLN